MVRRGKNKNTIQNVRVVDQDAGGDSAYVERCISAMVGGESTITVLCNDTFTLSTGSSSSGLVAGLFTATNIRGTDDFNSMMGQFNLYRIRAVRFDVYDINQTIAATNAFSTIHDVVPFDGAYAPPPLAQVVDGPDSKNVTPGAGRASFFWRAKGTLENQFQAGDSVGAPEDFGGLRWAFFSPTISAAKYQVIVRAVVDFRGRN